MFRTIGAALIAACTLAGTAQATPQAAKGERLWQQRCAECHAVDTDQTGPRHRGVFGRRAGSVPDYDYSRAVRKSGVYWDAASLDRWLTDPEKFIPGQNMDFKVRNKAERAALIAYLQTLTPAPHP
ncbi:c-type cytochrome [Duganella aceris]|uniref:C-type cytochrome n=1 Tax=Duganella aceris TaxID=2703883 RepID=A0ABX0FVG6_9BURK|nr:c-type cytochrome [Duganella aceris]NGZ88492.1 c-type cytochrome [Duganella aceris]